MNHPTDLVENQTVKAQRHHPMNPSCRTRESAVATNRFEERYGSYAARLQQICFTMIRLLWIAMMIKMLKFKIQNPRQRLLSGQRLNFEILFGKKHPDVQYFIFFSNLVNILHAGPAAAATKIKIQIRGFLQLGQVTALTALEKLFKCCRVSAFLSGKWERCEGGLYGNKEYDDCRAENSPWLPIQTRGALGLSNKGRAANKSPQTAVIASSDVLRFVFHLN